MNHRYGKRKITYESNSYMFHHLFEVNGDFVATKGIKCWQRPTGFIALYFHTERGLLSTFLTPQSASSGHTPQQRSACLATPLFP